MIDKCRRRVRRFPYLLAVVYAVVASTLSLLLHAKGL